MSVEKISNLPKSTTDTSSENVRNFFDKFFLSQVTFPSNQIDAVNGFFLKRGFEDQAARSTAIVLLNQSRLENINPFELLDTLKNLTDVQLSQVVTEVLNTYRDKRSSLGYRLTAQEETLESRNIIQ
jgi:hypothetical protein